MEVEKMDNRIVMQSVKELVAKKEGINRIPERYIHNDRDIEAEAFASSSLPEVPVIDMAKLSSSCDCDNHELQKLHLASKHWGFFQVRTDFNLPSLHTLSSPLHAPKFVFDY